MSADQNDLWVFRDARKTVSRSTLLRDLHSALRRLFGDAQNRQLYYNALIQAGELESALADSNSESTESLADLTDALAFAAFGGGLKKLREISAQFLVVDEGPGRSGSTFLSVGEALISSGVPAEDIILLGSREPDLKALCAQEAASRWKKFKSRTFSPDASNGFRDCTYIGGGDWRRHFLSRAVSWPTCWPQMERLKFLSQDRSQLFKFDGLGRVGDAVRNRARSLAAAGFGCAIEDAGDGFSRYPVLDGRSLHFNDVSESILARIARYCAFRSAEFRVEHGTPEPLAEMLRVNLLREFQWEIDFDPELLRPQNMVVVDGRMNPHEWLGTANGQLLKMDGATHGDDHFFPGLTDIAWDIAGAAVEWNLHPDALDFLLSRYRLLTGA